MTAITTQEDLRALYPPPLERAVQKELDHLDRHCRRFIELSPLVVLATCDAEGRLDATPRGGPPGFVEVVDERTLVLPDWPGNNRLDALTNVVEHPEVGMLFLIPGVDETLRVNGPAEIRDDGDLRERFEVRGRPPRTVLVVTVREAYLHCAKALMRSKLWSDEAKVDRSVLPTLGQMLKDQIGLAGPAESQEEMLERYRAELY